VIFAVILIVITSLPYLWAAHQAGPDWVFSGLIYGVEDGHSYIAKMLRGAQGDWLFRSPYSTSEQGGALLYLPYLLLGKLLGPGATNGQLLVAFHVFRLLATAVLCWALYDFFSLFLKAEANRRWGLLLATLSGGLGWLPLIGGQSTWLGSFPLEFISPETFGFLAVFGLPHLVLARALLLWGLLAYLRPGASPWWRTALLWLALALTHMLSAGLGLLLIGLHWLLQRFGLRNTDAQAQAAATRHAGAALLGASLPLTMAAYQLLTDPYLRGWAAQNLITSPSVWHYLLAFSIPLVLSFWGWRHLWDVNARRTSFLLLWLVALPILLYLPFGLQRRFAEGVWIALLVLALAAFEARGGLSAAWRRVMLLLLPSTLVLLLSAFGVAATPGPPLFLPRDEVAVFEALREEIQDGDVLLSAYETGNVLPAWAPVRVVIGHGSETVDLQQVRSQVAAYYRGADDGALLADQQVDYVFWGPVERSLGDRDLSQDPALSLVVSQGEFAIYRVNPP
jgi:hypothetical protein